VTSKKHQAEGGRIGESGRPFAGQRAAVTMGGRPWQPLQADDVGALARAVKQTIWTAGRTSMTGRQRDNYLVALVRNRHPAALSTFSELAIIAATRRPEPPACSWCALRALTAAALEEPDPTPTPALEALLGRQCGRCQHHYAVQEVAERERREGARLTAAGLRRPSMASPAPRAPYGPPASRNPRP
jgi:hypothetical protein